MIAVDKDLSITLSGNGDVISEPVDGVIGIGSGGTYALAAARALVDVPDLDARHIAIKSMRIASDICVYTNQHFTIESIDNGELVEGEKKLELEQADRDFSAQCEEQTKHKIKHATTNALSN